MQAAFFCKQCPDYYVNFIKKDLIFSKIILT